MTQKKESRNYMRFPKRRNFFFGVEVYTNFVFGDL